MTKLEFIFHTEPDEVLPELFEGDLVDIDFWCRLDININGQSFFRNFSPSYYSESWFTDSYINTNGIGVPVFPFIHSLLAASKMLKVNKKYFLEDDQTSIQLCVLLNEKQDLVSFAPCIRDWGEDEEMYYWYDGKKVCCQKEMPITKYNSMKYNDFKEGCIESVKMYIESLLGKYPEINKYPYFPNISK
ncbi:hypothetical protein SAMN05444673_4001 [Bacillus sp. OV166]|uniref:hypothetical protein n=1 Tax=Bacillus sp. OV166 TaxID=1882763 RepID=UPI000A2AC61B|nr:hypothetical protein [Bacillus sp. OV166]SMQ80844.1 hypothetical protein SAMN05444673_4001 [Bacillus sp. OV166]